MTAFSNALRSEWIKMASLRSTWVFAILLVGAIVAPIVLMGLFVGSPTDVNWARLLVGSGVFSMIAVAFAGSSVAGEFNNYMHAQAYLSQNNRHLWLGARQLLNVVFLLVMAVIGALLAYASTFALPDLSFVNEEFKGVLSIVLSVIVFGLIAMAIATLTRSRVAAVAIPIVWLMAVEQLLTYAASVSKVAQPFWLAAPGVRINQLGGSSTDLFSMMVSDPPVGWQPGMVQPMWFNIAVIAAWIVASLIAAMWVNAKRDVK